MSHKKLELSELLKKVNSSTSKPLQKVTPLNQEKDETQFSFWMESDLLKQLKMRALEEDTSIKNIINKSIASYISNK